MELGELHRTIHGRTAEREVASGEMYRKTRKHGSDAMSQNVKKKRSHQHEVSGEQLCLPPPSSPSSSREPPCPSHPEHDLWRVSRPTEGP